jgi:hypothetical protein
MSKYFAVALLLLWSLFANSRLLAQEIVSEGAVARQPVSQTFPGLFPRPFAYTGLGLMGGGYSPLAAEAGAGLRIDSQHFLASAEGTYDNGHKTNDNDQPNPNGHDRGLIGLADFRLSSGWFFGAGVRWSELLTSNYTKSAWRPTFGGGKDYFHRTCPVESCDADFSMRLSVDYILAGSDHTNALQGPLVSLYIPSPSVKRHIFFRETIGIYTFHQTVTEPSNLTLTRQQTGDKSVTSFGELTLMYRF